MGVNLYRLLTAVTRDVLIGDATQALGVIGRLPKITELGLRGPGEIETVEALRAREYSPGLSTPRVVLVADHSEVGPTLARAHRVLGWNAGRLLTQDLDWDHLPPLGWAVAVDRTLTLYREDGGALTPLTEEEAVRLGILREDGTLAEHFEPAIEECVDVLILFESHYRAMCRLRDGRTVTILGESDNGELPPVEWFVGRTTREAGGYRLTERLPYLA